MIPIIALTWWQWALIALAVSLVGLWVIGAFLAGAHAEGLRQRMERQSLIDAARLQRLHQRSLERRWQSRSQWEAGVEPKDVA